MNPIEKIGDGLKIAAKDVEHAVVDVVEFLPRASAVLASAIKDQPEVKSAITDLLKQASTVISTGTVAVTDKGFNLMADAATLAAAESFFGYFKAEFIPLVERIYGEIETDLN